MSQRISNSLQRKKGDKTTSIAPNRIYRVKEPSPDNFYNPLQKLRSSYDMRKQDLKNIENNLLTQEYNQIIHQLNSYEEPRQFVKNGIAKFESEVENSEKQDLTKSNSSTSNNDSNSELNQNQILEAYFPTLRSPMTNQPSSKTAIQNVINDQTTNFSKFMVQYSNNQNITGPQKGESVQTSRNSRDDTLEEYEETLMKLNSILKDINTQNLLLPKENSQVQRQAQLVMAEILRDQQMSELSQGKTQNYTKKLPAFNNQMNNENSFQQEPLVPPSQNNVHPGEQASQPSFSRIGYELQNIGRDRSRSANVHSNPSAGDIIDDYEKIVQEKKNLSLEIKRKIAEIRANNLCFNSQLDEIQQEQESVSNNYSRLLSNNSFYQNGTNNQLQQQQIGKLAQISDILISKKQEDSQQKEDGEEVQYAGQLEDEQDGEVDEEEDEYYEEVDPIHSLQPEQRKPQFIEYVNELENYLDNLNMKGDNRSSSDDILEQMRKLKQLIDPQEIINHSSNSNYSAGKNKKKKKQRQKFVNSPNPYHAQYLYLINKHPNTIPSRGVRGMAPYQPDSVSNEERTLIHHQFNSSSCTTIIDNQNQDANQEKEQGHMDKDDQVLSLPRLDTDEKNYINAHNNQILQMRKKKLMIPTAPRSIRGNDKNAAIANLSRTAVIETGHKYLNINPKMGNNGVGNLNSTSVTVYNPHNNKEKVPITSSLFNPEVQRFQKFLLQQSQTPELPRIPNYNLGVQNKLSNSASATSNNMMLPNAGKTTSRLASQLEHIQRDIYNMNYQQQEEEIVDSNNIKNSESKLDVKEVINCENIDDILDAIEQAEDLQVVHKKEWDLLDFDRYQELFLPHQKRLQTVVNLEKFLGKLGLGIEIDLEFSQGQIISDLKCAGKLLSNFSKSIDKKSAFFSKIKPKIQFLKSDEFETIGVVQEVQNKCLKVRKIYFDQVSQFERADQQKEILRNEQQIAYSTYLINAHLAAQHNMPSCIKDNYWARIYGVSIYGGEDLNETGSLSSTSFSSCSLVLEYENYYSIDFLIEKLQFCKNSRQDQNKIVLTEDLLLYIFREILLVYIAAQKNSINFMIITDQSLGLCLQQKKIKWVNYSLHSINDESNSQKYISYLKDSTIQFPEINDSTESPKYLAHELYELGLVFLKMKLLDDTPFKQFQKPERGQLVKQINQIDMSSLIIISLLDFEQNLNSNIKIQSFLDLLNNIEASDKNKFEDFIDHIASFIEQDHKSDPFSTAKFGGFFSQLDSTIIEEQMDQIFQLAENFDPQLSVEKFIGITDSKIRGYLLFSKNFVFPNDDVDNNNQIRIYQIMVNLMEIKNFGLYNNEFHKPIEQKDAILFFGDFYQNNNDLYSAIIVFKRQFEILKKQKVYNWMILFKIAKCYQKLDQTNDSLWYFQKSLQELKCSVKQEGSTNTLYKTELNESTHLEIMMKIIELIQQKLEQTRNEEPDQLNQQKLSLLLDYENNFSDQLQLDKKVFIQYQISLCLNQTQNQIGLDQNNQGLVKLVAQLDINPYSLDEQFLQILLFLCNSLTPIDQFTIHNPEKQIIVDELEQLLVQYTIKERFSFDFLFQIAEINYRAGYQHQFKEQHQYLTLNFMYNSQYKKQIETLYI